MTQKTTTFGESLKKFRLEAQMGLRAFADLIDMAPSNLSNIERGRTAPPASRQKITQICDALGLAKNDSHRAQLFDLASNAPNRIPADVANTIKEKPGVPVLVRTVANKQLSEEKLRELTAYIEEHY